MAKLNINTSKVVIPQCYAYTTPGVPYNEGWTKIGYTERDVQRRILEQVRTAGIQPKLEWHKNAVYEGTDQTFTDKEFHSYLSKLGYPRKEGLEWFEIDPQVASAKFNDFRENRGIIKADLAPVPYKLRAEQEAAVRQTMAYFATHRESEFLWNAKPRFGKTIAAYDLCIRMGLSNILVVTNRPAIANSWYEDYKKFIGVNSGYYFVSHVEAIGDRQYVIDRDQFVDLAATDENVKGCIQFVSLQDIKGSKYFGGEPHLDKLRELSNHLGEDGKPIGIKWDILIIDEAHEGVDTYKTDMAFDHIDRKHTLHLSGTPFKALANDKFPPEAIYNWTYADEQEAKHSWDPSQEEENPYAPLPQLNLFTYKMSDIVRKEVEQGTVVDGKDVDYAFNLNDFFATYEGRNSFVYNEDVDRFLDALVDQDKFPFSTPELRDELNHTFWLLNRVDSARALARKLKDHPIFRDYEIILAAGDGKVDDFEETKASYDKVVEAIDKYDKTITLSVGQLTTGITIPQWTGVLMLCNMKSPALYMQAAFRSQNPHIYMENGRTYRKENAYVFDFDPARTLDIFEEFANDLYSHTSGGKGDSETRKRQVRELLNFFPIYGEDEEGSMVMLDAEKVMTIPRRIRSVEVVNRGFMSNLLFANIGNIFSAPLAVREIVEKLEKRKEGTKRDTGDIEDLDRNTREDLSLNNQNDVELDSEKVIGMSEDLFGPKLVGEIIDDVSDVIKVAKETHRAEEEGLGYDYKIDVEDLKNQVIEKISDSLISTVKDSYGEDVTRSIERKLEKNIKSNAEKVVDQEYQHFKIEANLLESQRQKEIQKSKSSAESSTINEKFERELAEKREKFYENLNMKAFSKEQITKTCEQLVQTTETEILEKKKNSVENTIRDHLRGFARTIPSFLMAYGDRETTLENIDKKVPEEVFLEVTSISKREFSFLRDGGHYIDDETGEEKFFAGKLFDEMVFNDAVQEFLNRKEALANYFDEDLKEDIFDYIPPQQTNQIYTPKKVVKEMVDLLEEENPGCFDDPDKTFADLYMKSGLYITEIVKRLYGSETMKELFPNDKERLNHIFANQVYGLAPTEIIYRIAHNYVLGFQKDIEIEKHNLRKLDAMEAVEAGDLEEQLDRIFDE